jgi:hypothetical protein
MLEIRILQSLIPGFMPLAAWQALDTGALVGLCPHCCWRLAMRLPFWHAAWDARTRGLRRPEERRDRIYPHTAKADNRARTGPCSDVGIPGAYMNAARSVFFLILSINLIFHQSLSPCQSVAAR